jgi:1,4-dihydroxy-2-naphthoate octaprenyltransferase
MVGPKPIFRISRANFLPASIVPFLIGAAFAHRSGYTIPAGIFVLGTLGVATAHLAANLFNDYFDYVQGCDASSATKSPFFGGSKAIQEGAASSKEVLSLALIFLSIALFCGLGIMRALHDANIFLLMLGALFLLVGYTAPPFKFAYRRMGEAVIFLMFGVYLVMASYYVFSGLFSLHSFFASLPISFLIAAVIICNEIPDYDNDERAGKHTIVSLSGKGKGYLLYATCLLCSYLSIAYNVMVGAFHQVSLISVFFYTLGVRAAVILKKYSSNEIRDFNRASGYTIVLHSVVGILSIVAILL